jgi:hypothetical protein
LGFALAGSSISLAAPAFITRSVESLPHFGHNTAFLLGISPALTSNFALHFLHLY